MAMTERMRTLRELFDRLSCFKVLTWGSSSDNPDLTTDRVTAAVMDADVVSSLRRDGRHAVVLDIDHPAWLVASSTPGHHHLYIDTAEGIPHNIYMDLLNTLSAAGVIESGYARASQARGHTDVRLPWVKKEGVAQPWASVPVPARAPDWASEPATEGWMD